MEKSSTDDSKVFTRNLLPSQAIIDQIYNLSELIQTKLVNFQPITLARLIKLEEEHLSVILSELILEP